MTFCGVSVIVSQSKPEIQAMLVLQTACNSRVILMAADSHFCFELLPQNCDLEINEV